MSIYDQASQDALKMLGAMVGGIEWLDILHDLAENSRSCTVRTSAADRLATRLDEIDGDAQMLRTVYRHSSDMEKRVAALEKLATFADRLQDAASLKIVATCSRDAEARNRCVMKLAQHQTALEAVAMFTDYRDTMALSLKMLRGNPQALANIACNSSHTEARLLAVKNAGEDIETLKKITLSSPYRDSAKAAIEELAMMAERLNDINTLKSIVLDSGNEEARKAATEKLASMVGRVNDMYALILIAIGSKSGHARKEAVYKLKDKREALASVASYSEFDDTKRLAGRLIEEIEGRSGPGKE